MERLQLSAQEELILARAGTAPAPGGHAARHAVVHLRKAWLLRELDPEMALFRAITAEEEAARALFSALVRRRYPGATDLHWRKHPHKAALIPFLEAVGRAVGSVDKLTATLLVRTDGTEPAICTRVDQQLPDGQVLTVFPTPPLDFIVHLDGKQPDFLPELQAIADGQGLETIEDFITASANERNKLLFAEDRGIPQLVGSVEPALVQKKQNVFLILAMFVMVDEHPEVQSFALQCLTAFRTVLARLRKRRASAGSNGGANYPSGPDPVAG